jgi:hypothetical protein
MGIMGTWMNTGGMLCAMKMESVQNKEKLYELCIKQRSRTLSNRDFVSSSFQLRVCAKLHRGNIFFSCRSVASWSCSAQHLFLRD